jgi:acetyl esterase/lipase
MHTTRDIWFHSGPRLKLSGRLYLPDPSNDLRAGAVFCLGFGGVKEGTPVGLCQALAEAGFTMLSFDYRGFGASEGERALLLPQEQVEDAVAALEYLATQVPGVDPQRIGLYGTSFGGGIAALAAARSPRPRAVVLSVPVMSGSHWMQSVHRWYEFREIQPPCAGCRGAQGRHRREIELCERLDIMAPEPRVAGALCRDHADLDGDRVAPAATRTHGPRPPHHQAPVYLFGADDDTVVPCDQTRQFYRTRVSSEKQLEIFPAGNHWVVYDEAPAARGRGHGRDGSPDTWVFSPHDTAPASRPAARPQGHRNGGPGARPVCRHDAGRHGRAGAAHRPARPGAARHAAALLLHRPQPPLHRRGPQVRPKAWRWSSACSVSADALIEGFRPGVMERLGLGPEVCLALNPKPRLRPHDRLGPGRSDGHGAGPRHQLHRALRRARSHRRSRRPPVLPLNLVGDFGGGGMYLAFGIACALIEAARSGQGQVVDAAMVDGAASLMTYFHGYRAGGKWPGAGSQRHRRQLALLRRLRDQGRQVHHHRLGRAQVLRRICCDRPGWTRPDCPTAMTRPTGP